MPKIKKDTVHEEKREVRSERKRTAAAPARTETKKKRAEKTGEREEQGQDSHYSAWGLAGDRQEPHGHRI